MPFPSPGDLLNPGIEPVCPALQADSWLLSHQESHIYIRVCSCAKSWKPRMHVTPMTHLTLDKSCSSISVGPVAGGSPVGL